MKEPVIVFDHVSKIYKLYSGSRARFLSLFTNKVKHRQIHAVDDASFTITKGEGVALMGKNGAGKSTILKMITQVIYPTEGNITVEGRVCALLELRAGFNPEYTGRENIRLKGTIMGMTDKEIEEAEVNIVEFAQLGHYIDQPVRTYSSGMKARLGFAINVSMDPEILIIDEALSVGDKNFQRKCVKRIRQIMSDNDVTLLFVSHSVKILRDFCTRGMVLEKGKILFDGPIDDAIEFYTKKDKQKTRKTMAEELAEEMHRKRKEEQESGGEDMQA